MPPFFSMKPKVDFRSLVAYPLKYVPFEDIPISKGDAAHHIRAQNPRNLAQSVYPV